MESNPDKLIRYEQATNLEAPEEPKEAPEPEKTLEPDVEEVKPETIIPKTEEPAEENPEEDVEEPEEAEVKLVPEIVIPASESVPKNWKRLPNGWITFTLDKKTKEK
jgi:hypothetical protein